MKLPTDYQITTLDDLRSVVYALGEKKGLAPVINRFVGNEPLEMTKEQYGDYKRLIWLSDPIRYYNGMEIKISTEDTTEKGDGSV